MRILVTLVALTFVLAGCAHRAAAPSAPSAPVAAASGDAPAAHTGTVVELPGAGGKASGYVAVPPEKGGKHPALIVIQEWWGLDDWIKQNADRLAARGYVVIAPDLYRGKATSDPAVAHELMRGLPQDRALADLEAAFTYLTLRPDVDPSRIGALGWCMGGGYALDLAVAEPRLRAIAMNYGHLVTDAGKLAAIHAALLGDFAGNDQGIPPADVREFEKEMRAAGKDVDIKIYEGAGHAFMNPNNKRGYDPAAAEDAWRRIDAFFTQKLSAQSSPAHP